MKKFLSLVLALVMTMSLVTVGAGAKVFTDDSKITYVEAVDVLSALEIIGGYADGDFQPATTLTRGAAAKIICNLLLGPTTAEALGADKAPFKDVPASHTFAGYIAYCSSQGIINGYADGTFKPGATVTGFQFLKMLLGALGYDATIEKFVGGNWSVQVAKLAMSLKLTAGNDEFIGTQAMTREEACLYALNTLKADLVEYDTKGTNIDLGAIGSITTGASKATKVLNAAAPKDQTIVADTIMQFAEQHFSKLKMKYAEAADSFNRPANTWTLKTATIGTYATVPSLTYTTGVKMDTLYRDLGLSKTVAVAAYDYYLNGAARANGPFAITKGDTTNKLGGNGALLEVYVDNADKVTVVRIDTYVGDVTSKRAATASKDASITVTSRSGLGGSFETKDFAVDDIVLYSYSTKAGEGVQYVVKAETVTGTVTGFTADKSVTVGGTTYDYSAKVANLAASGALKTEATVVLDEYGYAIDIDATAATTNYAYIIKSAAAGWDNAKAQLLFADGTVKDVILTDKHVAVTDKDIVSYKVNNKDQYTLTSLGSTANAAVTVTRGNSVIDVDGATVANGKTIFLVATAGTDGNVYNTYTGIKNVPSISSGSEKRDATAYCKTGTVATIVFIDATAKTTVNTSSKDVVFVVGKDSVKMSSDSVKGDYYTYDAIVNGEITKLDVKAPLIDAPGMYLGVSYDVNKVATLSSPVNTAGKVDAGGTATGTVKAANDVIGLGSFFYSYAKDCTVFYMDTDGNLTSSSIASIATDTSDNLWFKFVDGEVTTIVIQQKITATNGFSVKAVTAAGDAGAAVAVASAVTSATTATAPTALKADVTVKTDKTVSLVVTAADAGANVTISPASKTLAAGTKDYTFVVTSVSEDGAKTQTCTVTVSFTGVTAGV